MTHTRESIALGLVANVPHMESAEEDHYYVHAKYRGALLNAIQSILTLPSDIAPPDTVVASFGVREVRFIWGATVPSRVVAVFVSMKGYGVLSAGNDEIVWHPGDEHGEWLLEALRGAVRASLSGPRHPLV